MPDFSTVLIWVLIVPMLPAFIFQKIIPSSVEMSGPLGNFFKGMNVKLVGGIAGYCVLVYVAWFVAEYHVQKQFVRDEIARGPRYEEWHVTGQITLAGPKGQSDQPIISFMPKFEMTEPLGQGNRFEFSGTVPVKLNPGKTPEIGWFQTLIVSYGGYETVPLHMTDIISLDEKKQVIKFADTRLEKMNEVDPQLIRDVITHE